MRAPDLAYARMRELAKIFVAVGTQSVGGGASTLFLLRRFLVERHRLITEREFNEAWALGQLSPGIHLVALAGLLGKRIAGSRGVLVAVSRMMVARRDDHRRDDRRLRRDR
jgi:chromate transporter